MLSNRFTNVHFTADTDSFDSLRSSRRSFHSSDRTLRGSITYTFSAPKSVHVTDDGADIARIFWIFDDNIRFLQRKFLISSARLRAAPFSAGLPSVVISKYPIGSAVLTEGHAERQRWSLGEAAGPMIRINNDPCGDDNQSRILLMNPGNECPIQGS